MRLIRVYIARLCFRLSSCIAITGMNISGIEFVRAPQFPLYHC